MTQSNGYIPDEWLLSYAAGALSEGHAMIVSAHAAYHAEVGQKIADAEAIGGALLEDQDTSALPDGFFDDLMAKLEDEEMPEVTETTALDKSIPASLAAYLGKPLDDMKWRFMGPGLKQCQLWTGEGGEKLWLLKAKAGASIPMHDHSGLELTLILKGSYHVGGTHYTPGLVEVAEAGSKDHQPVIDDAEDCICLVVTEAPIKIHNWIGRMVQPFIGL